MRDGMSSTDLSIDTLDVNTAADVNTADSLTENSIIIPKEIVVTYPLAAASVDANIFIADDAWQVTSVEGVWGTAASDSGTLMLEKCSATAAPSSGTDLLTAAINLEGTANQVYSGALTSSTSNLTLADGDRLGIDLTGTMTALAGGILTVHLKRV